MEPKPLQTIDIRNRFAALREPGRKGVVPILAGSPDSDRDAYIQEAEPVRPDREEAAGTVRGDLTEDDKAFVAHAAMVIETARRQREAREDREAREEARVRELEARLGELNAQQRLALLAKLRARRRR